MTRLSVQVVEATEGFRKDRERANEPRPGPRVQSDYPLINAVRACLGLDPIPGTTAQAPAVRARRLTRRAKSAKLPA